MSFYITFKRGTYYIWALNKTLISETKYKSQISDIIKKYQRETYIKKQKLAHKRYMNICGLDIRCI